MFSFILIFFYRLGSRKISFGFKSFLTAELNIFNQLVYISCQVICQNMQQFKISQYNFFATKCTKITTIRAWHLEWRQS